MHSIPAGGWTKCCFTPNLAEIDSQIWRVHIFLDWIDGFNHPNGGIPSTFLAIFRKIFDPWALGPFKQRQVLRFWHPGLTPEAGLRLSEPKKTLESSLKLIAVLPLKIGWFSFSIGWFLGSMLIFRGVAPENRPKRPKKEISLNQPLIFRGELLVLGRVVNALILCFLPPKTNECRP